MKIKSILTYYGVFLFAVGVLGFFVWGPDAAGSVFGDRFFFSPWESWLLMIMGGLIFLLALVAAWLVLRWIALLYGGIFVFAGVYAFFADTLWRLVLQKPADGIFYLTLGLFVLVVAVFSKRPSLPSGQGLVKDLQ